MKRKIFVLIASMVWMTVCGAALFAQMEAALYVGDTPQGGKGAYAAVLRDLYDVEEWLQEYAEEGGDYTIVLGKDQKAHDIRFGAEPDFGYDSGGDMSITLSAAGGKRTVTKDGNLLFNIYGVTFTLEEGVTLSGAGARGDGSLVSVEQGGTFIMNGGVISGNTATSGGGVSVDGSIFIMNGGVISGNTDASGGGGVYVGYGMLTMGKGTFIMNGGTISGNTTKLGSGGGVHIGQGMSFVMKGGTIAGNTAGENGGGVYVNGGGTFTKSGGIIYGSNASKAEANKAVSGQAVYVDTWDNRPKIRDTTADETTTLDSAKNRIQGGGWD
jgi:hypothetical protein